MGITLSKDSSTPSRSNKEQAARISDKIKDPEEGQIIEMSNSSEDLLIVGRFLAEGSYGKVYTAETKNTSTGQIKSGLVVKVVKISHPGVRASVEVELEALTRLRGTDGIVQLDTYFALTLPSGDEFVYIVLERLHGGDLFEALFEKNVVHFDEWTIAAIMCQMVRAIQALHKAGYLYLDNKPENWGFCFDPVAGVPLVKLMDFNLAYQFDPLAALPIVQRVPFRGSPGYHSSEQLQLGAKLGPHTDVYGLGVLMYCMLSRNQPFPNVGDNGISEERVHMLQRIGAYDRNKPGVSLASRPMRLLMQQMMSPTIDMRPTLEEVYERAKAMLPPLHPKAPLGRRGHESFVPDNSLVHHSFRPESLTMLHWTLLPLQRRMETHNGVLLPFFFEEGGGQTPSATQHLLRVAKRHAQVYDWTLRGEHWLDDPSNNDDIVVRLLKSRGHLVGLTEGHEDGVLVERPASMARNDKTLEEEDVVLEQGGSAFVLVEAIVDSKTNEVPMSVAGSEEDYQDELWGGEESVTATTASGDGSSNSSGGFDKEDTLAPVIVTSAGVDLHSATASALPTFSLAPFTGGDGPPLQQQEKRRCNFDDLDVAVCTVPAAVGTVMDSGYLLKTDRGKFKGLRSSARAFFNSGWRSRGLGFFN